MSARYERHDCETSETRTTRVRHEGKNFDFDNGTSENICPLQGEKKIHSKNYLLEVHRSYAKMRLKNAPQKLNFIMAKVIHQKVIH